MRYEPIASFMTRNPTCIQRRSTIADAHRLMKTAGSRHLPVLDGERLIGIVTQKALYRLETVANIDRSHDPVTDALEVPFVVEPGSPIGEVAVEMAQRKVRAAVIADGGKVLGIFTTTDALLALVRPERRTPHARISGDAG
jgi:acetoin utilization protein AcuB